MAFPSFRFFTFTTLLAAALFSAAAVVPFLPNAKKNSELFFFEVMMSSSASGSLQLYYDSGTGFSEKNATHLSVVASPQPRLLRIALPPGRYQALRFDPIDRAAKITIESLRVVGRGGRMVAVIPLSQVSPAYQIVGLQAQPSGLELSVEAGSNDPQLSIPLSPPLELIPTWWELLSGFVTRAVAVFVALAAGLFWVDRSPRTRLAVTQAGRRLAARPGGAIAAVAAVMVIASAYPVVFLGNSFVSPNGGTTLLYDSYPTLPGYDSAEMMDAKGSDVGAILWQHVAYSMIQHRALAQGELPLWNRYNSAGSPLLGQGQSMFGDPLHGIVVLCNGAAWAWDLKYLLAKWLFATGLGGLVFALTRHLASALIVTAAAPFIGFYVLRFNHPAIFSLSYAPWVLYTWVRISQAAQRRAVVGWIVALMVANGALMNSGTAKEAYMLLLTMNFSGACALFAADASWKIRWAKFGAVAWAGLLFVALTLPIWGTFLHTLGNAYTTYNAVSAYQIHPSLILGAFDELFYRPLNPLDWVFNPSINFLLLGGLLYFLATFRTHFPQRLTMGLAASAVVPLAFAFGLIPPAWIVQVPFLGNVAHIDNCFSCALIVLWSVFAGVGFAQAFRRLGTAEGRGDLVIAGLLLFAIVFLWIAFRQTVHRSVFTTGSTFSVLQPGQTIAVSPFIWGMLASLLTATLVLAWAARRTALQGRLTPAMGIVMALCAAVMLWRQGLQAKSFGFEDYVVRPVVRAGFHEKSDAVEFLRAAQSREPMRSLGLRGNFFGGWTGAYGLESLFGADALVNPFYRELSLVLPGVRRDWEWRLCVEPPDVGKARRYLDALNVRFYLDQHRDPEILGAAVKRVLAKDLDVYESDTAWPRAFFTDRLFLYDQPAELVGQIGRGDGRPFAAARRAEVAARPELSTVSNDLGARTATPATAYRLTENSTSFDVRATAPGVIVLNEVFWPGDFRAELNGRKVPVLRLNHAFKGVQVDAPGDYHVTFRYVPRNFPRNLIIAGFAALLLAVSLFVALRGTRRRPPVTPLYHGNEGVPT